MSVAAQPSAEPALRLGARVLLLDPHDRVLLIHARDPDDPPITGGNCLAAASAPTSSPMKRHAASWPRRPASSSTSSASACGSGKPGSGTGDAITTAAKPPTSATLARPLPGSGSSAPPMKSTAQRA